jgi:hypothetical protein
VPTFDFSKVLTFPQSNCAIFDALREARGGAVQITTKQTTYEIQNEAIVTADKVEPPQPHAKLWLRIVNPAPRVTSVIFLSDNIEPAFFASFEERAKALKGTSTPDGVTTVTWPWTIFPDPSGKIIPMNVGVVVVSSDRPLPPDLQTFDAGWPERFRNGAKANGWQVDAVWMRVEDLQPG